MGTLSFRFVMPIFCMFLTAGCASTFVVDAWKHELGFRTQKEICQEKEFKIAKENKGITGDQLRKQLAAAGCY